jgi:hypothetical protein
MIKDSKRYASTGGWGFGSFDGATLESQLDTAGRQACFDCHIPRKDHGYVFLPIASAEQLLQCRWMHHQLHQIALSKTVPP